MGVSLKTKFNRDRVLYMYMKMSPELFVELLKLKKIRDLDQRDGECRLKVLICPEGVQHCHNNLS